MQPRDGVDGQRLATDLADRGVQWVVGAYADMCGRPRGKFVPVEYLPSMLAGSERYTPRGLDGLGRMDPAEPECMTIPDPATLQVLPWDGRIAFMAADLVQEFGPYELCARSILKRQLARAAASGYRFMLGVETEFYVFRGDGSDPDAPLEPLCHSAKHRPTPAYLVDATLDVFGFLGPLVDAMQTSGFGVFSFDHEGGPGQYEFDFAHDDALATSDKLLFFRIMAKEYAQRAGGFATFMPKPSDEGWGSGAHFNMSLERLSDGRNVFVHPEDRDDELPRWTETCRSFAAGIMEHASAISAVAAPTVNSYKRLVTNLMIGETSWAPVWVSLGDNNRSCMLRLPHNRPALECRLVDGAANAYLASALFLAAGLDGIERGLDPGEFTQGQTYEWDLNESNRRYRLPRNLLEAIDAFEGSKLASAVFSESFVRAYVEAKTREWDEYHASVSNWERRRYLTAF